jgi:rubrerythrin
MEVLMLEELTPRKAVEFAVKTEELGQVFYKKLARKFEDKKELKEMFELLARDESIHEKQFRTLMEKIPADEFASGRQEQVKYLRAMSISQFFRGEGGLYNNLEDIHNENDALLKAFELEKAALQYYGAMKEAMGENEIINAIIGAEKEHLMKLMSYIMSDAKFRGISDTF